MGDLMYAKFATKSSGRLSLSRMKSPCYVSLRTVYNMIPHYDLAVV